MLRPKFHEFIIIFGTSFCTLFCKRTIINSSVYRNYQNIINYQNVIDIFNPPPNLVSKPHWWFSPLFSRLFPIFWMNQINYTIPFRTYVLSLLCLKRGRKLSNHSDSHYSSLYIVGDENLFLTQQARDWISNGSLFVWSGLVIRYWVLRLIVNIRMVLHEIGRASCSTILILIG